MPHPKDRRLMVAVEETIYVLATEVAIKDDRSASSYLRSLIIKDLVSRGLLTESVLENLVS